MHLKHLTPMLYTTDLEGTLAFYRDVLGFKADTYSADWGWLHINKDGVKLMFCLPNQHIPFEKPVCTGSFYFYTDEVEELWDALKHSPNIFYALEDFDYGMREFAIKDNNGYILQFGRELTTR